MRIVQLNSIESGFARSFSSRCEDGRQFTRQRLDMLQVHVRDALAITKVECLTLVLVQHSRDQVFRSVLKEVSELMFICCQPMFLTSGSYQRLSMSIMDL